MNDNLYARLAQILSRDPDRTVLYWQGQPMQAGELVHRVGQMAAELVALGLSKGDRVAVQVEKSPENIALYLAALQIGAVYLPLNTGYTRAELEYFITDAEPRVIVHDPRQTGLDAAAASVGARLVTMDATGQGSLAQGTDRQQPLTRIEDCAADDIAAILYTSGTTGRSKGAMLSHDNLWSNTEALIDCWGYSADDVLIHALPLFHTHGLFVALNMTLAAGARLHLLPKFDADEVLALMPTSTVLMGVPTFYARLLAHPGLTREAVANMRLFVSGSAPLIAENHQAFTARTGHAILERYGMTETCMNTSNPLEGERRPGSVGMPLPGVELRITGDQGQTLPAGEIGNIEVRGPNVFKGYWRMPEKTAAEFRADGFFITGDLGTEGPDGYVTIVGRGKDLIISGGYNVYPKEVEDVLNAMEGIAESAVIGVPHADFGEAVVALIVPEAGATPDEAAIEASLRDRLAGFKRPKRLILTAALPRNTMGKVQKNQLRDTHKDLFAT
ncbi:MAG: malonyl-CoA synthase [Paracoccus sp. (in: a-proteobacteria)]|nr:malonyl-CoA synthase [Paracoccus sp. (in: a-proteobacteria)]